MTKLLWCTIFASFTLVSASTLASPKKDIDYQALYDKCIDGSGPINNGTVGACSELASDAAKKEMNTLYQRIYKSFSETSPGDEILFEKSQKSWLNYRSMHCDLAGKHVGSPMYGFCPMQLNIQRVNQLRELSGG